MLRNQKEVDQEIECDMGISSIGGKSSISGISSFFRLELEYLRTSPLGKDEEKEKVTFEDYEMKRNLKDFYKLNNQLILENFQTLVSQEITMKFHPNYQKTALIDEILESSFCKFFGFTERKKYELITK